MSSAVSVITAVRHEPSCREPSHRQPSRRTTPRKLIGAPVMDLDGRDPRIVSYRRRRVAAVAAAVFVLALGAGASSVLASRGGGPASIPATRPASTYVALSGDTLWAISERFHGRYSQSDYVDRLIDVNGGPRVEVGQLVVLP